ncbi:MAG: ABC transporter permease [Oscillospiraceae bacterium]|jgi:D-methionine transport system permease protein|nr:ABC transporter permease [Oscillospiraceae bacterium]
MLLRGLRETLYMTVLSTALAYIIGLPLGILLVVTGRDGIRPARVLHGFVGLIINLARSIPFLILLIAVLPVTRFIVGTTIGSTATVVPLVLGAAPFIARLVESSLNEVDRGAVEAGRAMGASSMQIILKVLLPEAKPSLLLGAAIALTTILGYSAMAGIVGGGGLGDIAIRYGYYRYQKDTMLITVAILVVVVQVFQEAGAKIAKVIDKR